MLPKHGRGFGEMIKNPLSGEEEIEGGLQFGVVLRRENDGGRTGGGRIWTKGG